jgi:hypothetical protein
MRSFYQDRLATNIGKAALKKDYLRCFCFSQVLQRERARLQGRAEEAVRRALPEDLRAVPAGEIPRCV